MFKAIRLRIVIMLLLVFLAFFFNPNDMIIPKEFFVGGGRGRLLQDGKCTSRAGDEAHPPLTLPKRLLLTEMPDIFFTVARLVLVIPPFLHPRNKNIMEEIIGAKI